MLDLLAGDAQTFEDKVWASRVHVHHARPEDLVALLSLDDVDRILTTSGIRTPAVRLAQEGSVLPAASYTRQASLAGAPLTGLVDVRKLLDHFDAGATVVLQGLHRYWPALTRLVRDLELALGHPCQANAYLTPPGSQGFALHSDTHDVFVLQTHGQKRWEIHDGSGSREVLMSPGTSLYMPTGTAHAARTEDASSLHITIGINQVTWRQVLDRAVRAVLHDVRYDAHLPAGYLRDRRALREGLADRLVELADAVAGLDADAVAEQEAQRFLTTRPTAVAGGLKDRLAVRDLAPDTGLRRRDGSACDLVDDAGVLRVLLGDRELRVPPHLRAPLEFVRTHGRLTPADLQSWLDPESALVLTRRLVVEGLLEVVE